MRKVLVSYLLPIAALLLLAIVAFRWLNARNNQNGQINTSPEGIEISDLTGDEQMTLGVNDVQSAPLTVPETVNIIGQGEIRLGEPLVGAQTIPFTITTQLPELTPEEGFYQVWFEGEKGPKKAMRLVREKAGYVGDGAISSEFSELRVMVSHEMQDDNQIEELVLEGIVNLEDMGE